MNELIYDWNHDDADNAEIMEQWMNESAWNKRDAYYRSDDNYDEYGFIKY